MKKLNTYLLILSGLLSYGLNANQSENVNESVEQVGSSESWNPIEFPMSTIDWYSSMNTRVRQEDHKDRSKLQQKVRIGLIISDEDKENSIVIVASTGKNFNSAHNDVYDFREDDLASGDELNNIDVRNIYIERHTETGIFQIGALEVQKKLASTVGMDKGGWIDGSRYSHEIEDGNVSITLGSITDLENPDAFDRDHEFNYVELEISTVMFESLLVEGAYEHYDDQDYIRVATKREFQSDAQKLFDLVAEALVNVKDGHSTTSLGIQTEVPTYLTAGTEGVKFKVARNFMNENAGKRESRMRSGFKTIKGHSIFAELSKKLNSTVKVYARYVYDEETYIDKGELGVNYAF